MATNARSDPYRNFRFRVEIEGIQIAGFSDVSGYDMSINVVEYREGNEVITPRKLPGLRKHSNITLKKGTTDSMDIFTWINNVSEGKVERKSVTIISIDEEGNDSATWQVINSWPVKYALSEMKGTGNDVLIETLELAHEGMTRTK